MFFALFLRGGILWRPFVLHSWFPPGWSDSLLISASGSATILRFPPAALPLFLWRGASRRCWGRPWAESSPTVGASGLYPLVVISFWGWLWLWFHSFIGAHGSSWSLGPRDWVRHSARGLSRL